MTSYELVQILFDVLSASRWPVRYLTMKEHWSIMTYSRATTTQEVAALSEIVAGVDTHARTHHVAVLSHTGERLGDKEFPVSTAGYQALLDFVCSFGTPRLFGVEGTSSYGAGLARFLMGQEVEVREVIRPRRANPGGGKSDPIDAYAAARQALAEASSLPIVKTGEGLVEQIRSLLIVRRSAMKSRVAALRQIKSLLITAPQGLRDKWEKVKDSVLVETIAATRPAPARSSV